MSRVDLQLSRALARLKDKGEHGIQREVLLIEMNQVQTDLCRDYLAYKVEMTLTVTATQEQYPLDAAIYKVKEILRPDTWTKPVRIIHESKAWARVKHLSDLSTDQPLFSFTWNRIMSLWPAPLTTGEIINVLVYALPSVALALGGDPELNVEWDESLMLGTLAKISPDFDDAFKSEATKIMMQNAKESVNGVMRRAHSSDDIGF